MKCIKKLFSAVMRSGLLCLLVCSGALLFPAAAHAASGVVQLSAASNQVVKGDTMTVVCQVTSESAFVDVSFQISYDADILDFVSGGRKVSGGNGILQIASTGNSTAVYKKTFSLQFEAKKKGTTQIAPDGGIKVTDEAGSSFSMSSNQLTVTVVKKGSLSATVAPTEIPEVTPEPVRSKENRLKSLKVSALDFSPAFTPDGKEYAATVDATTETLYFTYVPQDEKARVRISGNEDLTAGENVVTVAVTAEDESVREYKIKVTKESQAETEKRENANAVKLPDVGFSIQNDGTRIRIKNSYEFEVLDPKELDSVPAGYIQSTIELEGISVPAFTMEHDLSNNYLLLYLKGPSGDQALYQYDRTEKTIQKYTGSMTERVNRGEAAGTDDNFPLSSFALLGIIIFLIITILCMLIAMLKMAMKKRAWERDKKIPDDLDF